MPTVDQFTDPWRQESSNTEDNDGGAIDRFCTLAHTSTLDPTYGWILFFSTWNFTNQKFYLASIIPLFLKALPSTRRSWTSPIIILVKVLANKSWTLQLGDLLASRGVGEVLMIGHHLGPEVRVSLHANKVVYIVEKDLDKSVIVCYIGKLWTKQPAHLRASGSRIVGLSCGLGTGRFEQDVVRNMYVCTIVHRWTRGPWTFTM